MGLLFRSGQEKQCVNITILDDQLHEGRENFSATLTTKPSTVASRVTLDPHHAVVNIFDNDGRYKGTKVHILPKFVGIFCVFQMKERLKGLKSFSTQ